MGAGSKSLKPRAAAASMDPREALRVASQVAPHHPPAENPARRPPPPPADRSAMLSMRFREATLESLARVARARGLTQKQMVARALVEAGVEVAAADAEDRPPPRRRGGP